MTMFLAPYTAIADIDGSPLDAGFLFFGEYGKDPELFPIEVFWDADFTVPAAQPIRTRNGYPVRNGSPTKVYLKTTQHSIVIKNRNSAFILVDFKNKGWDASFVIDGDRNQHEINNNLKNIHTLKGIKNPIDGQEFVTDEYLPGMGVGGGTYVFQKASSKPNRYGVWVRDNADTGAWVLISELYFEHFGVVADGTSQSTKIQACIDYAHESKIYEYGFEKVGNYSVSESIVFKPLLNSETTTFFSTESRVSVKTKGSTFLPTQNDITVFKVLREHVYIDSISAIGNGKQNITLLQIGRVPSDPTYTSEYRLSACFFKTDEITATSVDTGIMFGTAGFASYYYDIGSIAYRNVTHGMIFENDPDQRETVTRSNINSFKHNGGACSLIGLNLETLTIDSFFAENINGVSSKYPYASKRAIYIPQYAFYEGSFRQNHTIKITGSTEDVPLPVYCKASNCEINIYSAHFNFAAPDAFVGYFNSGRSGWGNSASLCTDLRDFVFPYFSYRAAPLSIVTGSSGVASLPDGITEAYGSIEWQPTGVYNTGGIQTLKLVYPFVSEWIRRTNGTTVATTTFGKWVRIDKPEEVQVNNVANDTDCNTLKVSGTERTYHVYYTGSVSGVNSPTGGEFLGAIKWIGLHNGDGVQIAYGTYPNIIKRRNLRTGNWTVWKTVQEI